MEGIEEMKGAPPRAGWGQACKGGVLKLYVLLSDARHHFCHFTYWEKDHVAFKFDFAAQPAFLPDVMSHFGGWFLYKKSAMRRRVFSPAPVKRFI